MSFYVCPLLKICLTMVTCCLMLCIFTVDRFRFSFVQDDDDNCEFFVWVDKAEEVRYFENNRIGDGNRRTA